MQNKKIILIVEQLATSFIKNNLHLTVAESCTGGWIAKVITDRAGSSQWFERGFVTYSNQAKQEMLGVTESTLKAHGAVSEETVIEMATGALNNSHADFALSVSGIAGPNGGSSKKHIGLVWFCWANTKNAISFEHKIFSGDRESVREQAVIHALIGLNKVLIN